MIGTAGSSHPPCAGRPVIAGPAAPRIPQAIVSCARQPTAIRFQRRPRARAAGTRSVTRALS